MEELQSLIFEAHQQRLSLDAELLELRAQVREAERGFERMNKWYRRIFQRVAIDEAASNLGKH